MMKSTLALSYVLALALLAVPACSSDRRGPDVSVQRALVYRGAVLGPTDAGGSGGSDGAAAADGGCADDGACAQCSGIEPVVATTEVAAAAKRPASDEEARPTSLVAVADAAVPPRDGGVADGGSFNINDPFSGFDGGTYKPGNQCAEMSCKFCKQYKAQNPGQPCTVVGTYNPNTMGHAFNLVDLPTQTCIIDYLNPGKKLCVPKTDPPTKFSWADICAMYPEDWCVKKKNGDCYRDKSGRPIGNPACQANGSSFVALQCSATNTLVCNTRPPNKGQPVTTPIPTR